MPSNQHDLNNFPPVYTKFVEDKILSEQETLSKQKHSQNNVTEKDIKLIKR